MYYSTKLLSLLTIALGLSFASCDKDDNNQEKKEDLANLKSDADQYEFFRNSKSTVSYSGQTTRLKQTNEIHTAMMKSATTADALAAMFKEAKGFTDKTLEGSKNVRSKTANSVGLFDNGAKDDADAFKKIFDGYLKKQVEDVFPNWTKTAEAGKAGYVEVGSKKRYVNAKGLEYNQAFMKSLIGGLVADQVLNHYLNRLDDNYDGTQNYRKANTEGTVAEGKDYTTMEHHWDEGYGYVYGNTEKDALLHKYIVKVDSDEDFKGIYDRLRNAFGEGRLAIAQKDYDKRDAQIKIIRKDISKVIAIRAIYYLKAGKDKLSTRANAFHDLSEGYGFVFSLRFITLDGRTPIFSKAEVDGFISKLEEGNGFWDISAETLTTMMNDIAKKFDDIDVAKV